MRQISLGLSVLFLFTFFTACNREVKPPKEKIFRYAIQSKITSLDPQMTTDVYSTLVQSLAYESLYEFHYLKRPLQIVPLLAESLPKWSADHKTMRVKLKKGIFFQDDPCFAKTEGKGRELVAQDVSDSLHRLAAPKFISPHYPDFEEFVVGVKEYHEKKAPMISGIQVLGPNEIEIRLKKSSPRFALTFTSPSFGIFPKECVEYYKDDFANHAVGTGAFKIIENSLGQKITAVRNPHYHSTRYPADGDAAFRERGLLVDADKELPFLDKVVVEAVVEDQPTWLKFLAGQTEVSRVPKDSVASALPNGELSPEMRKRGVELFKQPRGDVTVLIFNMEDPVWGKKKELRQAVRLALDIPKIIQVQYSGFAIPAHSMLSPSQYGYDENYRKNLDKRDIARAKELLAKAGYPGGQGLPPLVIATSDGATSRVLDELMTMQLAEAGISLKRDVMTWPEIIRKMKEKNFQISGLGYAANTPSPEDAFGLFHSRSVSPGQNVSNYSNPKADRLIESIETMVEGPALLAKIRELSDLLNEELPNIPLTHRIGVRLVQPWVKNHAYVDEILLGSAMKYLKVVPSP